jgi:2-oxoglutarate dehydrogenase E2 component (dihydrolipoamide succinyltransferase)
MAVDVAIPPLGESVTEAILVEWLKEDGAPVRVDEPVALIETDKADAELPAPAAGVLRHLKSGGDTVKVGEAIARIEAAGGPQAAADAPAASKGAKAAHSPAPGPAPSPPSTGPGGDGLSPAVRRLVTEHGLDPAAIQGSGKEGRLTKEDVLAHVEAKAAAARSLADDARPPLPPATSAPPQPALPAPSLAAQPGGGVRREPMSRIRKRIAANLVEAQHTAAMLTTFNEVDMSAIFALRAQYKERFEKVHGVSLGLMSFFVRAAVLALQEFENVNASIEGEDVVYHDFVHMGIAVSTEKGLVVPVLKNAQAMTFANIEAEIKRVAGAAREGKLSIHDLSGGTFTITNGGVFGSMLSTPILLPPQTGILGMHAIKSRPVAVGEDVRVRPVMYVALTYDHRLVDGRDSVTFLVRMKELLEDPARMMLEV